MPGRLTPQGPVQVQLEERKQLGRLNQVGKQQEVVAKGRVTAAKETKPKLTQIQIDAETKRINDEKAKKDEADGIKQGLLPNLGKTLKEIGKGTLKGAGQTIREAQSFGEKVLQAPLKLAGAKLPEKTAAQSLQSTIERKAGLKEGDLLRATNPDQKLGKAIEQTVEFFAPVPLGAKANAAVKATGKLGRLAPYVAEGTVDAVSSLPLLFTQKEDGQKITPYDVGYHAVTSLVAPAAYKAVSKLGGRLGKGLKEAVTENTAKQANKVLENTNTVDIPTNRVNEPIRANNAEIQADKSLPINANNASNTVIDETGEKLASGAVKESKFAKGVAGSPITNEETAKRLTDSPLLYNVQRNKEVAERAVQRVNDDARAAENFVLSEDEPSAEHTATAIELIRRLQKQGDDESAVRIVDDLSAKLTKAGQAVQAAKLYENLSPEAILIKAKKFITKENKKAGVFNKQAELSIDDAKKLREAAERMQGLTGDAKTEVANEIAQILSGYSYSSFGSKLSSAQTQAQLLNPKTILVRNPLGNELLYRVDRVAKLAAIPVDYALSKLTGNKRTIAFTKTQGTYWNDFFEGAKAGWKGVKIGGLDSQFDIKTQNFKNKWSPFYWGEKAIGASLKSFDYAAYNRARQNVLAELGYLRAKSEGLTGQALKDATVKYTKNADAQILEIADQYGKYITFQDDNIISRGFIGLKKGLNVGKDFGLGDLVLKYPKTPGALLSRALEFSPAGFLKSTYQIASAANKLKLKDPATQRDLAMSVARAALGTAGFTGLGYYLADKGFLSGRQSDDKDIVALQKRTGQGKYQINLSAIKRWVASGFKNTKIQPNDKLYTYDWAQPLSVSLSIGANLNEGVGEQFQGLGEQLASGAQTVVEQPLFTGITRLFAYGNVLDGISGVAEGALASFTPTLLNQFRQFVDNQARTTKRNSKIETALNLVRNKIPGSSENLPPKYDTLGDPVKNLEKNNIFNVFFSPGTLSTLKESPETKLVLDLIETTGETKQVPRVLPTELTILGEKIEVSPKDYVALQRYAGERTMKGLSTLLEQKAFNDLSDEDKVKVISNNLTDTSVGIKSLLLAKKLMEMNAKGEDTSAYEAKLEPADMKNVQGAIDYLKANPKFWDVDQNPLRNEEQKNNEVKVEKKSSSALPAIAGGLAVAAASRGKNTKVLREALEPLIKKGGLILTHGGKDEIVKIDLAKSKSGGMFFLSDSPRYAQTYADKGLQKGVLSRFKVSPDTKLIDIRYASKEELARIKERVDNFKQDFSEYKVPIKDVFDGARRGKSHYAENPMLVQIYKDLGYDGLISYEDLAGGKNFGFWNIDKLTSVKKK